MCVSVLSVQKSDTSPADIARPVSRSAASFDATLRSNRISGGTWNIPGAPAWLPMKKLMPPFEETGMKSPSAR